MDKTAREMVETFQCPGCIHNVGDVGTRCGKFRLHEVAASVGTLGMRCENNITGATDEGGKINLGLPVAFARVQYRENAREEVKTNIRLFVTPSSHWDRFNVPVWGMEQSGYLFVRTYLPRVDQSYVDVIQGGRIHSIVEDHPSIIDVGPIAERIPL